MKSVLPRMDTEDSATKRFFEHPDAIRGDGPELIFCGHFDGHDVYRRLDADLWVLVYANTPGAVFEAFGSKVWRAEAEGAADGWGTYRAIVKAKACVSARLNDLWCDLSDIARGCDEGDGWRERVIQSCSSAADVVYLFQKGVGL